MLISSALGMSPAASAGDVPSPPGGPAADGGPVAAFGDQIRQLLGAWALAPANEGRGPEAFAPAATSVNAAPRSPQAPRADEPVDGEAAAPLPASAIADMTPALWLDPIARQVPVPRSVPDAEDMPSTGAPVTRNQGHQAAADPGTPVPVEPRGAAGVAVAFPMPPGSAEPEVDGLALHATGRPRQADAIPDTVSAAAHATGRSLSPLVVERPVSRFPAGAAQEHAPPAIQEMPREASGQGVPTARAPRATEQLLSGLDIRKHATPGQSARATNAPPVAVPRADGLVVPDAARVMDAGSAADVTVAAADGLTAPDRPVEPGRTGVKPTTAAHRSRPAASADAAVAPSVPAPSRPLETLAASPTGSAPLIHGDVESSRPSSSRATDAGPVPLHVAQVAEAVRHTQAAPTVADAMPSEAPQAAAEAELPDQIVQSLRLQITGGGGEARVHLRPEYLGELSVRVVVEDGVVTARLEAEVPAVREWIERHEVSLRQALGEHGLTLDELSVSDRGGSDEVLDGREQEEAADRERPQHHRRARRRADDDGPRFEVTA